MQGFTQASNPISRPLGRRASWAGRLIAAALALAGPTVAAGAVVPQSDSLVTVVARLLVEEQQALLALQAELDAAPNEAAALAVQRRIELQKQQTQLEILCAQLRDARAHGRASVAAALAVEVAALQRSLTETQPLPTESHEQLGTAGTASMGASDTPR